jgi:cytochrome P450
MENFKNLNFQPFSAGPRKCIGFAMALTEAKQALSLLVRNFDFEFGESYSPEITSGVSYFPVNRFPVKLTPIR